MRRFSPSLLLLLLLAAAGCGDNTPLRPAATNECRDVRPGPPAGCAGIDQYLHTAGLFDTDGNALGLAVVPEDVAPDVLYPELYVADGENGLLVVDACDPARMSVVSRVAHSGSAHDVAASSSSTSATPGTPTSSGRPRDPGTRCELPSRRPRGAPTSPTTPSAS
jgi:hypothetical protein